MKTALHCAVEEERNIFKIKASFKLPLFSLPICSLSSLLRNSDLNMSVLVHETGKSQYIRGNMRAWPSLSHILLQFVYYHPGLIYSLWFALFVSKINQGYESFKHTLCSPVVSASCLYYSVVEQNTTLSTLSLLTSALNSFSSQVNNVFSFHLLVTR